MGDEVLAALYRHLKDRHSITPENISDHLDILGGNLEEVFGKVGTRTIGRSIAKRFYLKMGLEFMSVEEYTLQDYFEEARKRLLK